MPSGEYTIVCHRGITYQCGPLGATWLLESGIWQSYTSSDQDLLPAFEKVNTNMSIWFKTMAPIKIFFVVNACASDAQRDCACRTEHCTADLRYGI